MYKKSQFVLFIFLPFFYSCVSLTEVHNYATTSVKALNNIDSVDYTFKDYCQQDCELQQLRAGEIRPDFICTCLSAATSADEAIQEIRLTVTAYLQAVASLSNNKAFSYDVSDLTQAVQKGRLLNLDEKQVSVATKAGSFIATAATTMYRKKKLKQYLGEADTLFQNLTKTLVYLVDNRLRAQLKFEYDARLANVKQMLDNANDMAVKQMVIKSYVDEKAYYNKHDTLIDAYVVLLKAVQKGYHELYTLRYKLNLESTKKLIRNYSQDLQDLASSVK
ncbi:MAG: hypothetical protein ACR2KZ_16930 [Segetibacter sp.]